MPDRKRPPCMPYVSVLPRDGLGSLIPSGDFSPPIQFCCSLPARWEAHKIQNIYPKLMSKAWHSCALEQPGSLRSKVHRH